MGENIENTTKTTDSQEQTPFDSLTNESRAREDNHSQEQTPFDSLVNESKTKKDNSIEEVLGKIESYIQTQLDYIQNCYKSPEFTEKYKDMLRELANSSPDDDNIWTPKQKKFQRELFELVQQLESLKQDQPQINPDNEETQEPKSHIEIINEQIEEYIQKVLDSAKDEHESPGSEYKNRQKLNEFLHKLANTRSDDAIWTNWIKGFHPELFKLVVKKEIESHIQTQLDYIQNCYKSPEFTEKYKDMLRELANSSPDDDNIWTPKQKKFQRELFELVQQLESQK